MKKSKGFGFQLDREKILLYKDMPAWHKLLWLEEANRFCNKFVTGERRKIWEKIRRGEF